MMLDFINRPCNCVNCDSPCFEYSPDGYDTSVLRSCAFDDDSGSESGCAFCESETCIFVGGRPSGVLL